MEAQTMEAVEQRLKKDIKLWKTDLVASYHLRNTLLLSSVPLICGLLLVLLMTVFAKLNLFYLEANGLILDSQVRDAYFKQMELELWDVVWYLLLQLGVTVVVSYVVMRWASAPFRGALNLVRMARENPERLRPPSRWLSESPAFDQIIWNFALQVKNGSEGTQESAVVPRIGVNLLFLVKFCLTFAVLSVATGYVMGIILGSVYERIVNMALQFVQKAKVMNHYFLAQQEVLGDATLLMTVLSLVVYFLMGWQISRYMSTMIFVFGRGVKQAQFPITLRQSDVYHELAQALNAARDPQKTKPGA